MTADLDLVVGGRRYGGWTSVQVTRSMERLAGSFSVEANDRWADQGDSWPIAEEDECRAEINGETVIDGYIDSRSIELTGELRSLSYEGRDRAAALVDCSAVPDRWTIRRSSVVDIARMLAEPFNIPVSVADGLSPEREEKLVINPGDTAFQAIEKVAHDAGVLVMSDSQGGIVITRAGTTRADSLILGGNIKSLSVQYDSSDRFREYILLTQRRGSDDGSPEQTRIRAEATDEGVRRSERVQIIRPERGITAASARRRADWEARIRAAEAESISVTVTGWHQPTGSLWPINALSHVQADAAGINGDLLISETDFSVGEGGKETRLRLVRPDAFAPEPRAIVRDEGDPGRGGKGTAWKKRAGGG